MMSLGVIDEGSGFLHHKKHLGPSDDNSQDFQAQYLGPSGSITEDPVCPQARELAPIYVHLMRVRGMIKCEEK